MRAASSGTARMSVACPEDTKIDKHESKFPRNAVQLAFGLLIDWGRAKNGVKEGDGEAVGHPLLRLKWKQNGAKNVSEIRVCFGRHF